MGVSHPIQSKRVGQPEDFLGLPIVVLLNSCGSSFRSPRTHRKHCSSRSAKGREWAQSSGPYLLYGSRFWASLVSEGIFLGRICTTRFCHRQPPVIIVEGAYASVRQADNTPEHPSGAKKARVGARPASGSEWWGSRDIDRHPMLA